MPAPQSLPKVCRPPDDWEFLAAIRTVDLLPGNTGIRVDSPLGLFGGGVPEKPLGDARESANQREEQGKRCADDQDFNSPKRPTSLLRNVICKNDRQGRHGKQNKNSGSSHGVLLLVNRRPVGCVVTHLPESLSNVDSWCVQTHPTIVGLTRDAARPRSNRLASDNDTAGPRTPFPFPFRATLALACRAPGVAERRSRRCRPVPA